LAPNLPFAQKLFLTHLMVLLGDEAQVEAGFSPFGDSANLDARYVHGLPQRYHRLENHFRHTRQNTWVMWVMWNLISICLETVLVPVQDRCTVCNEHTVGSEIILDAHNGTPGRRGYSGSSIRSILR
jgi:hypothetical protein